MKNFTSLKSIIFSVILVLLSCVQVWGQLSESFESGLPTSYTPSLQNVNLGSGTWQIRDVIAGTTGVQTGAKSAQIRNATDAQIITPTLYGGVATISFYVTASTTSGAYQVNISTDNGANWSPAPGSPFTISTTKSFRSITVNNTSVNKVQIYRTSATIYIDDVTITSTGVAAPINQASEITFSSIGQNGMTAGWTNGNGAKRVVIMNTTNTITNPTDGSDPTATTTYSGSGQQVVYNGSGNSVAVTGLNPGMLYWFRVYEYNGSGTSTKYLTTTAINNPNSQTTIDGPCISEGFNGGITAPYGWTFTNIGGTYTSSGNYGASSPSLQMDVTGDRVVTSTVGQAVELKFWFKGQGTMTGSSFLVQGYNGSSWVTVENITTISTTGTTKTYNSSSSPALPSGLSQFRFTYTKSSGNLAFDDVEVTCVSSPAITISPNSLSFTSNINTESAQQDVTVTGALLTTTPTYSISGADAAMFSASGVLTTSGGIVSVSFTPTSDGSKSATLTITGEGGSINKTVTLTGTGILEAPLAKDATNISDQCFTANWEAVPGASSYELSVYTKSGGDVSDLIISEYVEGTNGHKYIEIYNGTGAPVDLSNYKLNLYANGATTATNSTTLLGTLANGNTIVYKNSSSTIYNGTAALNPSVNFNGNDAVSLYKISSGSNVDIFGRIGEDPGSAWTSGLFSTVDKTLVRKSSVTAGITTNPTSGFPTLNTEWDIYSQDVVSYLGSHTMNSGSSKVQITGSPFTVTSGTSQQICGLTPGNTYYYTVVAKDGSISSSSSNEITVNTLSGSAISVTPASLSDMDYNYGEGPSGSAIFYVTGLSLTNPISITAPADFEISTDGSVFLSAITLPTASGTPVYVRLKSGLPVANYYNENIVLTSGSASNSVSCNGTVTTRGIEINNIIDATSWNMSMPVSGTLKVYERTTGTSGLATELFFSKYLEGESENKLLEIFNGTANTIVLTGHYKVQVFQIGSGGGAINWGASNVKTFELTGTLAPGETKVIYSKETNVTQNTTVCSFDLFKSSWQEFLAPNKLLFNGNDPIRLLKDNAPIDIIGQSSGNAPSGPAYWGNASINTLRTFLVRNKTVTSGANAVTSNTTSFTTLTTEWTQEQDIAEGVSGATCDAIQQFGQYNYVEQYNQWVNIAGKRDPSDGVTNTNQVTIKDAASRPCEQLKAEIVDAGNTVLKTNLFRVPIIVAADNTVGNIKYTDANSTLIPDNICAECDIAVLGNATLTASTENKKFQNATVMQGAKLSVNNKLIVNDLILKAGYESGNPYINFPTATMKVDADNGLQINGTFKYVRKMDNSRWYFMSFPYDVKVSEISSVDGTIVYDKYMDPDGNSATGWYIKYWNGSGRANDRTVNGHWIGYNITNAHFTANSGYVKADSGYIFALNSGTKEVVFPLKRSFTLAKEADKIINLKTYKNSTPDPIQDSYHNNWNLIGAPFLSKFTGVGTKIKSTGEDPLGTIYVLDNTTNTYTAMSFADFASKPMNPFGCYFIQASDDMASQGLNFSSANARMLAPRKTQETMADNVRVFCTTETGEDYINLILDDNENTNYNFGSDLVKWFYTGTSRPQVYVTQGGIDLAFDAVNYDAAQNIPVTVYSKSAGNVSFKTNIISGGGLSKLILTDNVAGDYTDLLTSDYTCTVSGGITTNRFFLSAQRIATGESTSLINGVVVVAKNGTIFVRNAPAGSLVEVFDAVGRQMAGKLVNSNNTELTINAHGVYMVRVVKENSSVIQKIIL